MCSNDDTHVRYVNMASAAAPMLSFLPDVCAVEFMLVTVTCRTRSA